MKINLWSINYWPELTGIGVYTTGMADYLADNGASVCVVTSFAYYPVWRKSKTDAGCLYRDEVKQTEGAHNIQVCRSWHYVPAKPTVLTRIIHEASFVAASFVRQLFLPSPDIYIIVSPPLLLGFAAWILSIIKRRPFLFHVQDLQPDAALGLGMLKPGLFAKILLWFERLAYDKAFLVSAISKQMCDIIVTKEVDAAKVFVFPNWADTYDMSMAPEPAADPAAALAKISPPDALADNNWKSANGYSPQTRLVTYAGNLGVKQGLTTVFAAAKLIQDGQVVGLDPNPAQEQDLKIEFAIVGSGAAEQDLRAYVQTIKLNNVRFFNLLPDLEHTQFLAESDICLIPQKSGSFSSFLPSKLLKILALGRPVLTNADRQSALYAAIEEGGFGQAVAPEDPKALAEAIIAMLNNPNRLSVMGEHGRQFVKRYEKNTVLRQFAETIGKALSARGVKRS